MAFIDLARARYSLRQFDTRPVEQEKLEQVLQASQLAPTACNYQPQRVLVVNESETLAKIKTCTPCHFNAPVVLVICYDSSASAKREATGFDIGVIDASIAATQMMLEAADIGLGTVWVENFDLQAVCAAFALPENIKPVALMPLGYPAAGAKANERLHNTRRPLSETVFYNRIP